MFLNRKDLDAMILFNEKVDKLNQADSLCQFLILEDRSLPYPYLISGFLSKINRKPSAAVSFYQKFIE